MADITNGLIAARCCFGVECLRARDMIDMPVGVHGGMHWRVGPGSQFGDRLRCGHMVRHVEEDDAFVGIECNDIAERFNKNDAIGNDCSAAGVFAEQPIHRKWFFAGDPASRPLQHFLTVHRTSP